ncbi:hypothetical protein [Microcoleus sp. K4-C2]|uniref:hypothetical protein n=1 Tax=Microcoleus sp. K4-C2 TaxID=2818792 RepID=UPI002FD4BADE
MLGVYRPDTRKFAALTALLHRSGGFLNVVVQFRMAAVEYTDSYHGSPGCDGWECAEGSETQQAQKA